MKNTAAISRLVIVAAVAALVVGGVRPVLAQNPNFPNFSSTTGLVCNDAAALPDSTSCVTTGTAPATVLQLTPALNFQSGSAWFSTPQVVTGAFSTTFTFQLTASGNPGDGFAFLIQNSSAGTTALKLDNGTDGCSLGFGDAPGGSCTGAAGGITNSLAIEFDTYQNTDIGDPSSNHVAIQSCGTGANSVEIYPGYCFIAGNANPLPITLSDGSPHTVTISFTPLSSSNCSITTCPGTLDVVLDNTDLFPAGEDTPEGISFDIATLGLGPVGSSTNGTAYVGFTAATGGAVETQDILSWVFAPQQVQTSPTPITASTPSASFTFSPAPIDIYSFSYAQVPSGDLMNAGGTPTIDDFQVSPSDWVKMVHSTWAATTQCIPYASAGGNCVGHRQLCQSSGSNAPPSGAQCPFASTPPPTATQPNPLLSPSARSALFSSTLDPSTPTFSTGTIFGVVEAIDNWTGLTCTFPSGEPESPLPCPQNGLVSYTGPGSSTGSHGSPSANSTYFLTTGGLLPTTMAAGFVNSYGWTNNPSPTGTFTSTPPVNTGVNGLVIAPIANIGYGWNPAIQGLPSTTQPVPGDQEVDSTTTCPNPITSSTLAPPFSSGLVNIGPLSPDGTYLAHYSSTDCAGNIDLLFTVVNGSWQTNYRSLTINVDTKQPGVTASFSPTTPLLNQPVTVTYSCSDNSGSDNSGLAACGSNTFTPSGTPLVGPATAGPFHATFTASNIAGNYTYPITATDVAGNTFTATPSYMVVDQPADLAIFNLASPIVKGGSKLVYFIPAINNGPNAATNVVVTDTLPAGTTLASAFYAVVSCTNYGCSIPSKGTNCPSSGNPVVVSCNLGSLGLLKNGTGAVVVVTVNVPTALKGKKISDTATISSPNRDPNMANNTSTANTIVR